MKKFLYAYIALVLILVFFSKTIYNFSLPRVSVVLPSSGRLEYHHEAYGVVRFSQTNDVFSDQSGQLDEIFVSENDNISAGAALAKINIALSENQAREIEFSIQKLRLTVESLMLDISSLQWEIESLEATPEYTDDIDINIIWELENADAAIAAKEKELAELSLIFNVGGAAKSELDKSAEELQLLKDTRQRLLLRIENQQQENLRTGEDKEKQRLATLRQKKDILAKTLLSLKNTELDIQKAEFELFKETKKEKEISSDTIKSIHNGIVLTVYKQGGSYIAKGEAVATVGIPAGGFYAEIYCSKAEGSFIEPGDTASISYAGKKEENSAVVSDIKPEGDSLRIKLLIRSLSFTGGEYIQISLTKQSEKYDLLVPNEAVVNEGRDNYIWIVRGGNGPFGTEYYSVRLKIFIAGSDDNYTAVSNGLYYIQPVILYKNKDLTMNGRVIQQ